MITLKKTAEELENEKRLEFLMNHDIIADAFYKWFYDTKMLAEILQEDVNANDTKTVEALNEFMADFEEEYEDWKGANRL